MKKVLAGILILVLILGLAGCSSTPETEETTAAEPAETMEQTPEPTPTETPSNWKIDNYVDDFGDETEDKYIVGSFTGEFSNTATMASDLRVLVYYLGQSTYSFRLLEYGNQRALVSEYDEPVLKTKINGEISEYDLFCLEDYGDLYLEGRGYALTEALSDNIYEIACVIECGFSKYTFKINGTGFAELLPMLNGDSENPSGDEKVIGISAGVISFEPDILTLKSDGTVEGPLVDVTEWSDIIAVSEGNDFSVGLREDGTVVAVGENKLGQCNVSRWNNIKAISAGGFHTVGLKNNGTVVATGTNDSGQCDVSDWTDIVAISAGSAHTIGLKSDGTVVAAGMNINGQCNVSGWTDIIAVACGGWHTIGLKSDGTVVAVGENDDGQCNVSDWTDIISIAGGGHHSLGVKKDGTVVAVGNNEHGQCDVGTWTGIDQITAGCYCSVGLKNDGSLDFVGWEYRYDISYLFSCARE